VADKPTSEIASGSPSKRRLAEEGEQEWLEFPNLIGNHLSWRRSGSRDLELMAADGSVWATINNPGGDLHSHGVIWADGRAFEVRQHKELKAWVRDVVDIETDETAIVITGSHFDGKAGTRARISSQVSLEFPVKGHAPTRAVMYAVDDTGNVLIRYRMKRPKVGAWVAGLLLQSVTPVEVVVSPTAIAIPNSSLLVAASSKLLVTYFQEPPDA
jgi:hypothetical protein